MQDIDFILVSHNNYIIGTHIIEILMRNDFNVKTNNTGFLELKENLDVIKPSHMLLCSRHFERLTQNKPTKSASLYFMPIATTLENLYIQKTSDLPFLDFEIQELVSTNSI